MDTKTVFTVNTTENITLHCAADGIPAPNINWIRNGALLDANFFQGLDISSRSGVTAFRSDIQDHRNMRWGVNSTLIITNIQPDLGGTYNCRTGNDLGVFDSFETPFDIRVRKG